MIVRLGVDSKGFNRGMGKAQTKSEQFGRAMANVRKKVLGFGSALVGVSAIYTAGRAIKNQLDYADAVGKTSDKLGITTEELSQFHFASKIAAVDVRQFELGIQRMTRRISEAAQGMGEAQAAIVRGFLDTSVMGLPEQLQKEVDKTISTCEKEAF